MYPPATALLGRALARRSGRPRSEDHPRPARHRYAFDVLCCIDVV